MRYIGCGHCGNAIKTRKRNRLMKFVCPHCQTYFTDECDCPDWEEEVSGDIRRYDVRFPLKLVPMEV